MNKRIIALSLFLAVIGSISSSAEVSAESATWQLVGPQQINFGLNNSNHIAFNPLTHEPYIAFIRTLDDKPVVMKFDGSNWVNVGSLGFTSNPVDSISFAFNPATNEPYISFTQGLNDDISVMKFNGSSWVFVGNENFFTGAVGIGNTSPSLAFNPVSAEPYVAFKDTVNASKLSVMKFNGSSWSLVGTAGVSAGTIDYAKISFKPASNEAYVAYRDEANSGKATVMKFNGSSWLIVGNAGFNSGSSFNISLAFNPATNEPYIAYFDGTSGALGSVMKFNGNSWIYVGAQGFLNGGGIESVANTSISFNPSTNEPYVAYTVGSLGASVRKFDGSDWVLVGSEYFTPGEATSLSFAFNSFTGAPYVFFKGPYTNGSEVYRPIVMSILPASVPSTPIYRLYNTVTGVHLYTKGVSDRDYILNKFPAFEFTDNTPAFYASLTEQAGLTPIYRLYNTVTGVHLYTKGVSDRDYILNKFPAFEFTDNAPAFYASLTEQAGLTPIYRLYNTVTGVHLYTKGVSDRDYILNKFPAFEFTDGVPAFYAELN